MSSVTSNLAVKYMGVTVRIQRMWLIGIVAMPLAGFGNHGGTVAAVVPFHPEQGRVGIERACDRQAGSVRSAPAVRSPVPLDNEESKSSHRPEHTRTPLQIAADLADDAFSRSLYRYTHGMGTGESVYRWSRRVLRCRLWLAPNQRQQALEAHVERMRALERDALKSMWVPPLAKTFFTFFRAEAEHLALNEAASVADKRQSGSLVLSAAINAYKAVESGLLPQGVGPCEWHISRPELRCRWSARWARAEDALDPKRRREALKAHLNRLKALEKSAIAAYESGQVPFFCVALIGYHRAEAEYGLTGDASAWVLASGRMASLGRSVATHCYEPDNQYLFSMYELRAALAADPTERAGALAAHHERMLTVQTNTALRVEEGTLGASDEVSAAYYAAEAAAWLDQPPGISELVE